MTLGAEIRAAREAAGMSLRQLARRIRRSPGYMSIVERDLCTPAPDTLDAIIAAVDIPCISDVTPCDCWPIHVARRDRWMALAGRFPDDLVAALLAGPARWDDVRALLAWEVPRGT